MKNHNNIVRVTDKNADEILRRELKSIRRRLLHEAAKEIREYLKGDICHTCMLSTLGNLSGALKLPISILAEKVEKLPNNN